MKFEDLKFKDDKDNLPVVRALVDFDKFHLSIIKRTNVPNDWYEAAILDAKNDKFLNLPGINEVNDVIPHLTPNKVTALINKLKGFTGNEPKQVKKIK